MIGLSATRSAPSSGPNSVHRTRATATATATATAVPPIAVFRVAKISRKAEARKKGRISVIPRAAAQEANNGTAATANSPGEKPTVRIDNHTDPFATIVSVKFGDKLGDLLDTIAALKNLGLNIKRAKLEAPDEANRGNNKFYVTDVAKDEKIMSSAKLEEIRLTILNIMISYHPEAAESLNIGTKRSFSASRDVTKPLGASKYSAIETSIDIKQSENNRHTVLRVITRDRPGLLVDMVHILKDVSVNVLSAEIDTIGEEADDTLLITYHGEPLSSSMEMLVKNALQYYLSLADVAKVESY